MKLKKQNKKTDPLMDLVELYRFTLKTQMNSGLLLFFWVLGDFLISKGKDSDNEFLKELQSKLTPIYGKMFTINNIKYMILFVKQVPNSADASGLGSLVSWQHIKLLLKINNPNLIFVYAKICMEEQYSPSQLSTMLKREEIPLINQNVHTTGLTNPQKMNKETARTTRDSKGNTIILRERQLHIKDISTHKVLNFFLDRDLLKFLNNF